MKFTTDTEDQSAKEARRTLMDAVRRLERITANLHKSIFGKSPEVVEKGPEEVVGDNITEARKRIEVSVRKLERLADRLEGLGK